MIERGMKNEGGTVRISKEFRWEMGHRLPFHEGGCRNLHGHGYRMEVEIEGLLDSNGMVMDYFDLKELVAPMVEEIDHCFLCDSADTLMLDFFAGQPLKHVVVPFLTTAENIAGWFAARIASALASRSATMHRVTIRLYETATSCAEVSHRVGGGGAGR